MLHELSMNRAHTCCFTGSRPAKLGFDWQAQPYILAMLRRDLRAAIVRAIQQDYTHFITGMSQGFDLWAAEEVLNLQKDYPQIELICALPFPSMERQWPDYWQRLFNAAHAGNIVCTIAPAYRQGCFLERDRFMVEQSSRVICWYTGNKGGTKYTHDYAKRQGCYIENLYNSNAL